MSDVLLIAVLTVLIVALVFVLLIWRASRPVTVVPTAITSRNWRSGGRTAVPGGVPQPARSSGRAVAAITESPAPGRAAGNGAGNDDSDDTGPQLIDLGRIEGSVKASSVKRMGEIIDNHPGETLAVLRAWMNRKE